MQHPFSGFYDKRAVRRRSVKLGKLDPTRAGVVGRFYIKSTVERADEGIRYSKHGGEMRKVKQHIECIQTCLSEERSLQGKYAFLQQQSFSE